MNEKGPTHLRARKEGGHVTSLCLQQGRKAEAGVIQGMMGGSFGKGAGHEW